MRLRPVPTRPDPLERLLALTDYREVPLAILPPARAAPLGVLVRGTLEWMRDDQARKTLLQDHAPEQYTRELTLSALVKLLIQVSAGVRASVFAAFQADQASDAPSITTSFPALYGKRRRVNPAVREALVRHGAEKLAPLLQTLPAAADEPIPGRRLRILDGHVLAGTEHRLRALRRWRNACLPGKSLVVYEPGLGLVTDLVLCEDADTQERALLLHVLPRVQANDLWVADRNFCTPRFVFGVLRRQASVLIRQHRHRLPCRPLGRWRDGGATATGVVRERPVRVADPETGEQQVLRQVEVRRFDKTRDGEGTMAVLTNLPEEVSAGQVAEIYRLRWTIENHFQFLTASLHGEVKGLGKPRAALLLFALALLAGNARAAVRGALRQAHGREAEAEVSGYYLAAEIGGDYRTLLKYLPAEQGQGWRGLEPRAVSRLLTLVAANVRLQALIRSQRGPKKPPRVTPVYNKQHQHCSTARLLEREENSC